MTEIGTGQAMTSKSLTFLGNRLENRGTASIGFQMEDDE